LASGGDTLEEALIQAPKGLRFHVEAMLADDGDVIPAPTPFEALLSDPQDKGLFPFVAEVPTERAKSVRLNISLDERLVGDIDRFADRAGKTRSAFLADAARLAMAE
jgi:hypothetical protein